MDTLADTLENALLQGLLNTTKPRPVVQRSSDRGGRHPATLTPARRSLYPYLGKRQVCVPVAVSCNGGFMGKVSSLGPPTTGQDALNVVWRALREGLYDAVSGGGRPAQRVASAEGLQLVRLTGASKRPTPTTSKASMPSTQDSRGWSTLASRGSHQVPEQLCGVVRLPSCGRRG